MSLAKWPNDNSPFLWRNLMKKTYKMIVMTILVSLLFAATAGAFSVSDVKDSALTQDQKKELYTLMKTDKPAAEAKFEGYSLDLELKAIDDEATAAIHAIYSDTLTTMTRDECVTWTEAVPAERDDRVDVLSKRWVKMFGFEEPADKATTDDKLALIKKQVAERKLNAKINGATSGIETKLNKRVDRLVRAVNSQGRRLENAELRLDDAEENLESVFRVVNNHDFNLNVAMSTLRHTKVGDDTRDDTDELIEDERSKMLKFSPKIKLIKSKKADNSK
jgi:hypothetical protein